MFWMKKIPDCLQQYRNRISYIGIYLALTGLGLFLFTLVIDRLQHGDSSYVGLILIVFLGLVLLGTALAVYGGWRERRRAVAGAALPRRLDLNESADRQRFYLLFFGGAIFFNIVVFMTYTGYRYTEQSSFCGALCHPMAPEYAAYQSSSHAHVECVSCHVGPGLSYYLKYKLAGVRQLVALLTNDYPTPIPTPIDNLRPARAVCEHCHWPNKFFGTKLVQRPWVHPDEKNTAEQITLGVKIGGRLFHSIHYNHISGIKGMSYASLDLKEQEIPWVSVTRTDGSTDEYRSLDYRGPVDRFRAEAKDFDCIGCHNRPAHVFYAPDFTVNRYLAAGLLPSDFPWLKKVAVEALSRTYSDQKQAHAGIRSAVAGFYEKQYPELAGKRRNELEGVITTVTALYDRNIFPDMKVNWQTHIDNNGHRDWPGCFRCHDGRHATQSGKVLSRECTLCHTLPVRGPLQPLGVMTECAPGAATYWHPLDLSGKHGRILCSRCHLGGNPPVPACTGCHKISSTAPMISFGCSTCHLVPQEITGMTPCTECHSPTGLHTAGPHAETPCITCHKPHTWLVSGRETCLQCHTDRKTHNPGTACMTCHAFK